MAAKNSYRVQFTTRNFGSQHPELVTKFVRASIRGWREYLRNSGPTNANVLTLNPALNPAQEAYTAQGLNDGGFVSGGDESGSRIGRMSAELWQASYDQLKRLGILHSTFDPAAAYSLKFQRPIGRLNHVLVVSTVTAFPVRAPWL